MAVQKGNIGITTENIFPVIKKFLYSDHEIFLREIVSNAVDATQKLRTLSAKGEFKGSLDDLKVSVKIDKEAGTLTVSDNGIGMTAEEIDRYINQIAFSGATDFLEKYKDDAATIIGHFGLGFYSSFMVSSRVDIITRSYREDAEAVKWSCDGTPEFTLEPAEKAERGTDIVLHIDEENKDFLEKARVETLLNKYCRFLPVPVVFGKKTEWKDGTQVETAEDNVVNDTTPLWTKTPSTLTDEDYRNFYRELYPMQDEPLFWIHLNVDYPFNLTGVLYFPKIKNNLEIHRNKIQLFCNQVFVTDSVENIVPDFLTLLHGVIDSPDIPLNVSRSYLQSDANVKKISQYITKKVADRLSSLFKTDREQFEQKCVQKSYLAVVRGYLQGKERTDYPLKIQLDKIADKFSQEDKEPQEAVTDYEGLKIVEMPYPAGRYQTARYSLVKLIPHTGRKHQLRRHMKHIFHPILGDTQYGDLHQNRALTSYLGCSRLFLHSDTLSFIHPITKEQITITAGLDEQWHQLMNQFGWENV